MSTQYPLVGYSFLIIQDSTIAVTGDIVQGHGASSYLVRFNTKVPYTRVIPSDSPVFGDMNLFETKDQLGNFIELFHKEAEPSAANDVVGSEEGDVTDTNVVDIAGSVGDNNAEPEDVDNPAVA